VNGEKKIKHDTVFSQEDGSFLYTFQVLSLRPSRTRHHSTLFSRVFTFIVYGSAEIAKACYVSQTVLQLEKKKKKRKRTLSFFFIFMQPAACQA
jgi:hypothetical protein